MNPIMKERFFRAWEVLEEYKREFPGDMLDMLENDELNLMWVRNEAGLWDDWVEDPSMIVNGIDYNPNHPDNLSALVWDTFRKTYAYEVEINKAAFNR